MKYSTEVDCKKLKYRVDVHIDEQTNNTWWGFKQKVEFGNSVCASKAIASVNVPACLCYSHMLRSCDSKSTHTQRDDSPDDTRHYALMFL